MRKWHYNLQSFYDNNAISYYLLGAWMADGCIYMSKDRPNRKTASIVSKDKDWLLLINNYICPEKPLIKKGKNCYTAMYYSTELCDWFISMKCTERKSLTLTFPNVPKQYIFDFIRGMWDGDGSISFTKSGKKGKYYQRQANLTSGSLEFCQSLSNILNKCNIKCKVYPHIQKERKIEGRTLKAVNSWRVVISGGESVYNLCKLLYTNPILAMPRKLNIAKSIIEEWEQPVICITCNTILTKAFSNKKYCNECLRVKTNQRNRDKYHANKNSYSTIRRAGAPPGFRQFTF